METQKQKVIMPKSNKITVTVAFDSESARYAEEHCLASAFKQRKEKGWDVRKFKFLKKD